MKLFFRMVTIGLISVVCAACAGRRVEMNSDSVPAVVMEEREISSEACGFQLLLLIPIALNDRAERAYRGLQAQAGDDLITDVQVQEKWVWGFVGTGYCTVMKAKAIKPGEG